VLADYGDTYVRYRSGDTRLTLGAQTIIWGRADEIPLADRVSRADLTRFVLDDLADRRRAQLAARWEQTFGDYKLDAVLAAAVPRRAVAGCRQRLEPDQPHHGRIIGIDPALTGWVSGARIDEDEHGSGGGAVRLTKTGEPFDFGVTLARTRQSLPYYRSICPRSRSPQCILQHLRRRRPGTGQRRPHLAHGTRLHRRCAGDPGQHHRDGQTNRSTGSAQWNSFPAAATPASTCNWSPMRCRPTATSSS
jgi:hypothetical protein